MAKSSIGVFFSTGKCGILFLGTRTALRRCKAGAVAQGSGHPGEYQQNVSARRGLLPGGVCVSGGEGQLAHSPLVQDWVTG